MRPPAPTRFLSPPLPTLLSATALAALLACGGEPADPGAGAALETETAPETGAALETETASETGATPSPASEPPSVAVQARGAPAESLEGDDRLVAAGSESGSWLSHGRTYSEQRFSPLDQIDAENVSALQLAWRFETGLTRGHEATPLVVDGGFYFTGSWSVVFALDARTGTELWRYDPEVPREVAASACCDVVNRGVAYHGGRIFAASLDGRLSALDARSGELLWQTQTVDPAQPYTVTGAPRVVKGKVIIGNGGAELGVRGYVSAYDAETGEMAWRTYTVPGDPSQPFESPALEAAAETWNGEWWKAGGGGTAWDSIAFDPELDLLYVGTGNGSPWARELRSPGGGDNLYLSSILALNPDSGELVWHYQTTPADNWDFTATQHMILAELEIEGRPRKVLMQAPKNGFFYVLDRETGELLSAEKYVSTSWASHVDSETGRPVENPGQDYGDGLALVQPTAFGGHNWQPMSFHPGTGLVYIPAQEILGAFRLESGFEYRPGLWNTGTDANALKALDRNAGSGVLLAWDPVAQKPAWRHAHGLPWNGGTLATAGDLVFQGTGDGRFVAYRASDGETLWQAFSSTGIIAAPVTYQIGDTQYVSVVAGWGGAFGLVGGDGAHGARVGDGGEVRTYALPAGIPPAAALEALLDQPGEVADGERLYHTYCGHCHGAQAIATSALPDLREISDDTRTSLEAIVLQGAYRSRGMPSFEAWLESADVAKIGAYLDSRR